MKRLRFLRDDSGAAAVEFGITSSIYCLVLFGIFQVSIWLWTDFALHRGVSAGARCAAVTPAVCATTDAIQAYASRQSYGLNVPAAAFTVVKSNCGYQVSASYAAFDVTTGMGFSTFTANASACYPA